MGKTPDDIKAMPYEQAMTELEQIVQKLEAGAVSLEDSIAIYERGEALKARCETLLKGAEARIEKILAGPDGKAKATEAFDPE